MKTFEEVDQSTYEFPNQVVTDTATKSVTITPEIEGILPDIQEAFNEADLPFKSNPEKYLHVLEASMFELESSEGAIVECSLLHGPNSKNDEVLILFAPFADREPKSSADKLTEYLNITDKVGLIKKEKYAPNSWNQTTKSAALFELLRALGNDIPVLTIYAPINSKAYSFKERKQIRNGDFSPAGKLASEALAEAQIRLNGAKSETEITKVHIDGTSLGATNAVGAAASKLLRETVDIETVTAHELIQGPVHVPVLGYRFTIGQISGEPSIETVSPHYPKVQETSMRRAIDAHGSELLGTNGRMIQGMKPTYMFGITHPKVTTKALETILDNNISLLVALAENSALTKQTKDYLPGGGERVVMVRGEKGQKLGHIAGEHVALSALVTALNLA